MESLVNSLLFTLGVFLGVFASETDPAIALRAYRNADIVFVSADVRDAAGPGFRRLIDAGEPVRVELSVIIKSGAFHRELRKSRILKRDIISGAYSVRREEDNKEFSTPVRDAALQLLFTFYGLELACENELPGRIEISASADFFLPDGAPEGSEPLALWNYKRPAARLEYEVFMELPY